MAGMMDSRGVQWHPWSNPSLLSSIGSPTQDLQKGSKRGSQKGPKNGDLEGHDPGSSVVRSLGTMANPWFVGFDQVGHPVEIP